MADIAHLEKLGSELKCPICLSLLSSSVSVPCNHVFCNACILKSMKFASSCPVCKIPFHKRELRAAPHMDNLVNIFKSMEAATGTPVMSTQLTSPSNSPDEESPGKLDDNTSNKDQLKKKRNTSLKRKKKNVAKQKCTSDLKPCFPAKKRVHVAPFAVCETPVRPAKVLKLGESNNNLTDSKDSNEGEKLAANLQTSLSLRPFFCLGEEEGEEEGEEIENSVSLSIASPLSAPCFSDLKDTQDEVPSNTTPNSKAKAIEDYESEIFEWTQRPCSPELCSTPAKKIKGKKCLDQIQEEEPAPIDKISPVIDETRLTSDIRDNKSKKKKKRNINASSSVPNKKGEKESKGYAKNSTVEKTLQPKMKSYKKNPEKVTDDLILKVTDQKEEKEINKSENTTKMKRNNERGFSNFMLKRCESAPSRVICAFCHSADVTEVSGDMVHYLNGVPTDADLNKDGTIIHSHKNCLEWAPDVYFEGDIAVNLAAELARSKRIKCSCCGIKGAALGCLQSNCRKSFHFTCAKLVPECRWDNENFVMLCPLHRSSNLPIETSEPQKQGSKRCTSKGLSSGASAKAPASRSGREWSWPSGSPCKWVLACSSLSVEEKGLVSEFSMLIGSPISSSWSQNITHVIASTNEVGACKRTLKYLMAILSGKWILTIDWIKACMEAREPVNEENFEIRVDVHGIRDGPRLGRLRASRKEPRIFNGIKFYLSGDYTMSYRGFIQDLIVTAGGTVLQRKPVSRDRQRLLDDSSKILIIYSIEHSEKLEGSIGDKLSEAKTLAGASGGKVASSAWIIDSIAACKLQPLS